MNPYLKSISLFTSVFYIETKVLHYIKDVNFLSVSSSVRYTSKFENPKFCLVNKGGTLVFPQINVFFLCLRDQDGRGVVVVDCDSSA